MNHIPRASLIFDYKAAQSDLVLQMVLWKLPRPTSDRPHGIKYRLYLGRAGKTLVRYDNESGKGDHQHLGPSELEVPYRFSSVDRLLSDFRRDCAAAGWRWIE